MLSKPWYKSYKGTISTIEPQIHVWMDKTIVSLLSSSDDNNEGETPRVGQMMTLVCAVIYNAVQRSLDIFRRKTWDIC